MAKKEILKDLENDQEIKKEIKRLNSLYKDLEGNKKQVAEGLIEEAAFMRKTLNGLKRIILESGTIDEMEQGAYSILREHPALKSYNTTIQRYSGVIKQLSDLLPKETPKQQDDGFDDFIMSNK